MEIVNPIKILVFGSFCHALMGLRRDKSDHTLLLLILMLCLLTELVTSLMIWTHTSNHSFMTVSIILHDILWLLVIGNHLSHRKWAHIGVLLFLTVALLDLIGGAFNHFKYYTFVSGAMIYVSVFLFENVLRLRKEDIGFFLSDDYLLLAAPVLFFLDLSLMFGFDSFELTSFRVYGIKLYDLLIYFVNFSYYLLLNLYIYRQRKRPAWNS